MTSETTPPPPGYRAGSSRGAPSARTPSAGDLSPDRAVPAVRPPWPRSVTALVVLAAVRTCLHGLAVLVCLWLGASFLRTMREIAGPGPSLVDSTTTMYVFAAAGVSAVAVGTVAALIALFVRTGRVALLVAATVLLTLGGIGHFLIVVLLASGGMVVEAVPSLTVLAIDGALLAAGGRASTLSWAAAVRHPPLTASEPSRTHASSPIQDRIGHRPL